MAGSVSWVNWPRSLPRALRSASASAFGFDSAILRLAIRRMMRFPIGALMPRPVTVVDVSAETSTGAEVTSFSSRKMRRRASSDVMPRVWTVTGPWVPRVWETLVAARRMSKIARSCPGTKSRRTFPVVRPLPRTRVPRTTSSTGCTWSTGRSTAGARSDSATSRWMLGRAAAPRTALTRSEAWPDAVR